MWVLGRNQNGFQLLLSQIGLGMSILSTGTNGLRDIQLGAAVGGCSDSIDYKFDGQLYKITGRTSVLVGAELRARLPGMKTACSSFSHQAKVPRTFALERGPGSGSHGEGTNLLT
jgi:hypothetical protein